MNALIAKLTAAEGKEAEMRAALETMVKAVSDNEPGVLKYELHTDPENPAVFYFYELYETPEAQQAHGKTDHMKAFGAALGGGLSAGRPELTRLEHIAGVDR